MPIYFRRRTREKRNGCTGYSNLSGFAGAINRNIWLFLYVSENLKQGNPLNEIPVLS